MKQTPTTTDLELLVKNYAKSVVTRKGYTISIIVDTELKTIDHAIKNSIQHTIDKHLRNSGLVYEGCRMIDNFTTERFVIRFVSEYLCKKSDLLLNELLHQKLSKLIKELMLVYDVSLFVNCNSAPASEFKPFKKTT